MGNSVPGTPIRFHVNYELFYLIVAGGIIETDKAAAQHGHSNANNLSGTEMAMDLSRGR
jgi:hypothetical protein